METEVMTKDVGSILVGKEAVNEGIINEIGSLKDAIKSCMNLLTKNPDKLHWTPGHYNTKALQYKGITIQKLNNLNIVVKNSKIL